MANKEVKKAVTLTKNKAYEKLYQRLETNDRKKDVFRLMRARERKTRDPGDLRCVKDDDGKLLVKEAKIKRDDKGICVNFLAVRKMILFECCELGQPETDKL